MPPERTLLNAALLLLAVLVAAFCVLCGVGTVARLCKGKDAGLAAEDERGRDFSTEPTQALPEPDRFHEDLLRRVFEADSGRVSTEEAVVLVGLLYSSRLHLARGLPRSLCGARSLHGSQVPPLRLEEAVRVVASAFGREPRLLARRFEKRWGSLKNGEAADRLARRLVADPAIDFLEEIDDVAGPA